ncbi:MAG: alpha/beta fold hydrolase [Anaerolineae bacterium]|nr:alpha/beta fold hydrolase [Anaerolineae bacterium]
MTQNARPLTLIMALLLLLLAACAQPQATAPANNPGSGAGEPITAATAAPAVPAVTNASAAATVIRATAATATTTATATATPPPAPTATPTATPTPPHPLSIELMRQESYPGSDLVFEQTLPPGNGYSQYIVSYLSEGNKIYALLTIPNGEKPESGWPVVIFNHGFIPPDVYRTTERYEAYVAAFASAGYMVLRSDYRGHGSSEGEATGGYSSPAYTVDVLNGMASVLRHPDADPDRVGMWGHSMGGQITLRAMVVSDQIKAGVVWAGVVASYPDMLQHWTRPGPTRTPDPESTRRPWRRELVEAYGSPAENPVFWASISPNSYVADLSGPLQLHHGTADTSVPVILSELLVEEVQAAGKPVELHLYEGDNHNISNYWGLAMSRSVAFLDQYVKGLAAP